MPSEPGDVRVDKWLWAARLVKTRALAVEAIRGGRVEIDGRSVKPSRDIRLGDTVRITTGPIRRTVVVRGISAHRGPASEAVLLYEETAESRAERERLAAERRMSGPPPTTGSGRPTKRDRRRYDQETARRRRER